jgi:NAD dependent epimerase/dehydratase
MGRVREVHLEGGGGRPRGVPEAETMNQTSGGALDLSGRKVLVTGAAGFIGSHLTQALVREGARVRAMTHYRADASLHNLEHVPSEEFAALEIVKGDIADPHFVRRAVNDCDVVFHLAALIAIPYSYVAPTSYIATNVQGTLNVLEACRDEETPRLIHTSTSECYGSAVFTPIDESHPLQAQSPYSASKIAADKVAESYYRSFDLPVVTIRPFNTYGPRQSARAVIPTIIEQLLSGASRLELGSLDPVRDLTFVSDTIGGFIAGAKRPKIEGKLFNLGTGKAVSIGDLANAIMRVAGVQVPIVTAPERVRPAKSEVTELISDNRKAQSELGWRPTVSLEDGLAETVDFFRRNPSTSRPASYAV